MIGALLVLIAAAEVALLTLVIAMRRRQPDRALTLLILVIFALIWDNTVIAIGSTAGEGETLRYGPCRSRATSHTGCSCPCSSWSAWASAGGHGIRALAGRTVPAVLGALTVALIAAGIHFDIAGLDLQPTHHADTLRYTNAASHGAPIPAVVTILILIGLGIALLVRARQPWLLAGAAAMFVAAALGAIAFWIANIGELLLITGIWWTATRTVRTGDKVTAS
jgi:hypothetical protein